MSLERYEFGSWVEIQSDMTRRTERFTVAVNRRTEAAIVLDDRPSAELDAALREGGFLRDSPVPVDAPRCGRLGTVLRSLDVRWKGADRLVAAIYRRLLVRAWDRGWFAVQVVVAVAGVVSLIAALAAGCPIHLRPEPWHVPIYVGISLVSVAIHELGHAVVLARNGRKVAAVGLRLHLGSPAFYVESVEALLLPRRQRLIQAAAGPWAEWQFLSIIALALWLGPESFLTPVVHRFVVLGAVTVAANLLPFAGLDGSFLLADLVREPNLTAESKSALSRLLLDRTRVDPLLAAYAVTNTVVSAAMLLTSLMLWYFVFGGVIEMFAAAGALGWLGIALLVGISFGPALGAASVHLRRVRLVDRVMFRLERRRRIEVVGRLVRCAPFSDLDERSLSVLAGQLDLRRIGRGSPLHAPAFSGLAIIDGDPHISGDATTLDRGVLRVTGPGIAATTRRLWPTRAALLDDCSLRLVGAHSTVDVAAGRRRTERRVADRSVTSSGEQC